MAAAAPAPPPDDGKIEAPKAFTVAVRAAAVGDAVHLGALIEKDPKALTAKDDVGTDPLCWAARNARGAVVTMLLGNPGTDVEARSFGGMRALHHAVNSNEESIVRELLGKGADTNAQDEAGNASLHYACRRGVLGIVQALVEAKADVSSKNAAGLTPLHVACNNGHSSVVAWLLTKDADVNDADKAGNTPLHLAVRAGFNGIVKSLLAAGAKPSSNRAGKTPQQLCADPDLVKAIDAVA